MLERLGSGPFKGYGGNHPHNSTTLKYNRTTYGPVDVSEPSNYGATRASKRRNPNSEVRRRGARRSPEAFR